MKINRLHLKDKPVIDKFLQQKSHSLSSYHFASIFIWKDFFDFFWSIIEDNFCLFAKNPIGCFMYFPPLGGGISKILIQDCFEIMDKENIDKNISRIENVEEDSVGYYKNQGLILKQKDSEYIYLSKTLVDLKGNPFKSKRSAYNYFALNYDFEYCEFDASLKNQCLKLYKDWSKERRGKYKDAIFQAMLDDNLKVHSVCFDYYKQLELESIVLKVKDKVKAYSFGYKLNKDTFCILLEVADLSFKGLAQFIFREFCRRMAGFAFVNVMDDSGLDNIKQAKLSYRPYKLVRSFIAQRKDA